MGIGLGYKGIGLFQNLNLIKEFCRISQNQQLSFSGSICNSGLKFNLVKVVSAADPEDDGVCDAGQGQPLLPAAGLHPRGVHAPPCAVSGARVGHVAS